MEDVDDAHRTRPRHVTQAGSSGVDLPNAGFVPQLQGGLVDLGESSGPAGVAAGREASVGRERDPAAETGCAVGDESIALTVTAEAEQLVVDELLDRKGIVDLDEIEVTRPDDERLSRSLHGLTRTLVSNMVTGVTAGYEKKLEIVGVGYRVISKGPTQLEFNLGFSHPVVVNAPEGITFSVEKPTAFTVYGIDKQAVGEVAANIRKIRKPEPYKGKGVRYAGERVRRKVGKAGK